jgi:hypothetical protein
MTQARRLTFVFVMCWINLAVTIVDIANRYWISLAVMAVCGWIVTLVNALGWRLANQRIDRAARGRDLKGQP